MVALARPQVADLWRLNFTAHIKAVAPFGRAEASRPIKAIIAAAVSLVRRLVPSVHGLASNGLPTDLLVFFQAEA
jgi:hypothetical protein